MAKTNPIELQKALRGADYPATRRDLEKCAEQNKADRTLKERIHALPDKTYEGPDKVSREMFGS